jgi:hypothetical protein
MKLLFQRLEISFIFGKSKLYRTVMERIVIEVNKATAKKWRTSTMQQKRKITAVLQRVLKEDEVQGVKEPTVGYGRPPEAVAQAHFERSQKGLPEYRKFIKGIQKDAKERGLRQEILDDLLKKDD